jgi:hypothetical protein
MMTEEDVLDGASAPKFKPVEVPADFKRKGLVEVLRGKDYINHKGIVKLLHMHGVMSIRTWPRPELCSVADMYFTFSCEIIGTRCSVTMCADASPANVSRNIASAASRMAETRAINRAGRTYLGLGQTTFDEMPGDNFDGGETLVEITEPKPTPQVADLGEHDPSFAADQKSCFRRLKELKMDYEVVNKVCAQRGWPKLSAMTQASRTNILEWLQSEEAVKLYRQMEE